MAISITKASETSEFFSGDEKTLVPSFDNLHLGSDRNKDLGVCGDEGLSGRYLLDPIWGFQKDEFDGGVSQWGCPSEAGGVGNLSPVTECTNPGLMSGNGSFDYPLYSSSFYDSKNTCVDNLWEWNSQERSCSSIRWRKEGTGDLSMWDKMKSSVASEDVMSEYLKRNEVVYLASSKEGSQYLQSVLAVGDEEIVNVVFQGVYDNVFEVMMDQYGQHLFHRTFDTCTVAQQEKLVLRMVSDVAAFIFSAKNQHGSHSLQKLVKKLKGSPYVKYIAGALALDMKSLMISQYGKHVIQQCFILLDTQKCQVLYEALLGCCIELATHLVGCTSLNNSINNVKGPYRDHLLSILVENSAFLSQDPSGNFVLQYILSLRNPTLSKKICYHLQGQFMHLSTHKSGSHLVEKCLKSLGMEYVITDLLANQKQLLQLARDQFGNYVLQTAIRVARCHDLKMHQFLLQALEPHVSSIKYHPIGRNVFNVINSCVPLPKWATEKSSSPAGASKEERYSRAFEQV